MSYQVLARKWRPKNFHEMVGQKHVLKALINALDNARLHHAYLFTGTRGVGKTTIARIFAKSLNCEEGVSSTPCGQCPACQEINQGRFVDLIEVDAASRTKVEDTREILENVQYAPTRGRFKVYLIDEVHMLSKSSFNALLKTLEEPPEHVKFLLATTDPQKLPATVLSRCLQFGLKNMSVEMIIDHLSHVLSHEQIVFEQPALLHLAKAARGSMRDAMSLTDQAIAFGQGQVLEQDIVDMLGAVDSSQVQQVIDFLFAQDAAGLLQFIQTINELSPDYLALLQEIIAYLHQLAIAQMVPSAISTELSQREAMIALAQQVSAEQIQLFYQLALQSVKDVEISMDARVGFEMAMMRVIAFSPQAVEIEKLPLPQPSKNDETQQADTVKKFEQVPQAVAREVRSDEVNIAREDLTSSVGTEQPSNNSAQQLSPREEEQISELKMTDQSNNQLVEGEARSAQPVISQTANNLSIAQANDEQILSNTDAADSGLDEPRSELNHKASVSTIETLPTEQDEQSEVNSETEASEPALLSSSASLPEVSQEQQEKWLGEPLVPSNDWIELFERLQLTGMSATIFAHSLMFQTADKIGFHISEQYKMLYNEQHLSRLKQAMKAIGVSTDLPIDVEFAAVTGTPAHFKQQQKIILQQRALLEFKQFPVVQFLQSRYHAEIIEQSVCAMTE